MIGWKGGVGFAAAKVVLAAARVSTAPRRSLSPEECSLLRAVYRDSVDLDRVSICAPVSGVLGVSGRAFVIEDTMFLPKAYLPLPTAVLVHEICHVWQHQHGGHAYIADSLHAQFFGDGYQLEKGLREGRAWHQLNCEQQATLVEEAHAQGCFEGRPFVVRGVDRTENFEKAMTEILAGRGAGF